MVSFSHPFNFEDISLASVCSVENHAPPVVLRSERQGEELYKLLASVLIPLLVLLTYMFVCLYNCKTK